MKIDPTGSIRATPPIRRAERNGAARSGDFARHLDSTSSSSGVSGANSIASVDSLLAVQEADDHGASEERARKRASHMLDRLEDLRDGLLSGSLPRESLIELAGLVRTRRDQVSDAGLAETLNEIELRAAVELAKLEVRRAV